MKRTIITLLAISLLLPLFAFVPMSTVTASAATLAEGTMIYYEDFTYSDLSGNAAVLDKLGWSLSEELNLNTAQYSIKDGKLLCDNLDSTVGTSVDSYVTVLGDAAMSEVVDGNYSISYDLTYLEAGNNKRYVCMLYNYNGYRTYNSVHIRIGGYGNNQVRTHAANYYTYDNAELAATNSTAISQKLFSTAYTENAPYAFTGKTMTVTLKISKTRAASVYINGILVSTPGSTYDEVFAATKEYGQAVALKTSPKIKAYVDNIAIWTGNGNIPSNKNVTYKYPAETIPENAISTMSFNLLYSNLTDVAFSDNIKRGTHALMTVVAAHPDIVGFQERTTNPKSYTTNYLADSGYKVVDDYRTDTTYSNVVCQTPIYYNPNRFTLIENSSANGNSAHGALVFKDSYNVKNYSASQFAKNSVSKGMAWAVLEDKITGQRILAMNTHFSVYVSSYTGYTSADAAADRVSNAHESIEIMEKVYKYFGYLPTVYTGDFNMRLNEEAYRVLLGELEDSINLAPNSIFYEYSMTNDSGSIKNSSFLKTTNAPIDHIFVSRNDFNIHSYNQLNDCKQQMIASDHCALMTIMSFNELPSPTCSHKTGVYSGTQSVTLKGDGTIYYTIDGTDPLTSSTKKTYSKAISLSQDTELRFVSISDNKKSAVTRISLYFGMPFIVTEAIKDSTGSDHFEGIEIINISGIPVDLSDFRLWYYSSTDPSAQAASTHKDVTSNMRITNFEGKYIVNPGELVFINTIFSDSYKTACPISSSKSVYVVTLNADGTEVTYHTDYTAQAIAYRKAGNITADRIIPLDRTTRSYGYTENGTLVQRRDHYSTSTSAYTVLNFTGSFNMANDSYNRFWLTFYYEPTAENAFCIFDTDGTGGGVTGGGTSNKACDGIAGAYQFLPNGKAHIKTLSFTSDKYTIGYLGDTQKSAIAEIMRNDNDEYVKETTVTPPTTSAPAVTTAPPVTTTAPVTTEPVTTEPSVTTVPDTTTEEITTEESTPVTSAPITTETPTSSEVDDTTAAPDTGVSTDTSDDDTSDNASAPASPTDETTLSPDATSDTADTTGSGGNGTVLDYGLIIGIVAVLAGVTVISVVVIILVKKRK